MSPLTRRRLPASAGAGAAGPIQQRLGQIDALNEYIKHVGSALFAVPPGTKPGGCVGEGLL